METLGLDQYLSKIGRESLLTAEEERRLFEWVRDGEKEQSKSSPQHVIIERGKQAFNQLVELNLRLVIKIAKKHIDHGVEFEDLIQEGNLGLMTAVEKFDIQRGYRFSTYATWWIFQAVSRALANQGRTIRFPVYVVEGIRLLMQTKHHLYQHLQREPSLQELAHALGLSVDKVEDLLYLQRIEGMVSLEVPLSTTNDDFSLVDLVAEEAYISLGEVDYHFLQEEVHTMLSCLSPREKQVLQARYGFGIVDHDHTLQEISVILNISRERVRQIEVQALNKLRRQEFCHLREFLY